MSKRIIAIMLSFVLFVTSLALSTQTVYASDFSVNIGDYTTWEQITEVYGSEVVKFLKGVADSLGMTCSAFCSAVSSGAVSLSPYLMGAVAIGSACYLGYDIYTNFDTIVDQVYTELSGIVIDGRVGSAYADYYFANYANDIITGSTDLANGIEVPLGYFDAMTVSLSHVLTQDKTAAFTTGKTIYRSASDTISDADISAWLSNLGYSGTATCWAGSTTPLIAIYNERTQEYVVYCADRSNLTDLLIAEAGDSVYMQLQDAEVLADESVGYSLREPGQQYAIWRYYDLATGVSSSSSLVFEVANLSIGDGKISYSDEGTIYDISILVPQGRSVVIGNISYSALEFPLSYKVGYSWYDLLPYYWQVSALALADASVLDGKINAKTKAIPQRYIDAIDDAITAGTDIPIQLPWDKVATYVSDDSIADTTAITDAIAEDTTTDNSVSDSSSSRVFHVVVDGLLDILKEFAYWLLVPSDGFLDGFLSDMTATYEDATGILTYPVVALIQFLGRLDEIDASDVILTIPDVTWKDAIIFPTQSINLSAFIRDNEEIQTIYNYYLILCRGLLVLLVLNLAKKKQEEMTRG